MKVELSINENKEIIVSDKKEVIISNSFGEIQSCFITEQKNIICFICIISPYDHYYIYVFDQNMNQIYEENIEDNQIDIQTKMI